VCCYRAAHQAIIIDEATTYNQFVSGPWRKLFGRYDANNHILSSIMIKLSVTLGGLSEFNLRLPSLIAGFFLTVGVFWLLRRVESRTIRWVAFALVCLHPMLLDFSIAARGYSLSLAFFVWALYFCLERRYLPAGFLLGLSMSANLATLFPFLALVTAVTLLERRMKPLLNLLVPALLLGALISGPSLRRAHRDDFYIGYPEFRTAVTSFVFTSLHARPDREGILGDRTAAERIGTFGLPLFLALAAGASLLAKDRRELIPFLTLTITIFGLILARWLFRLNYPADRTCLYFVILGAVVWAFAADVFEHRLFWLVPAVLLLIQFSIQLQTRYFQFWRVEADDKIIAGLIQRASAGQPANSLAISTSWMHQPALEFYRRYLHITALKPVERLDPAPLTGFDFYVLSWGDVDRAKETNLQPVFADPDIQVMLAISSAASREGN
jgi:4-amino-4-deoxy-L-arabinose transferase-like glycosyltransferase